MSELRDGDADPPTEDQRQSPPRASDAAPETTDGRRRQDELQDYPNAARKFVMITLGVVILCLITGVALNFAARRLREDARSHPR